MLDVTRAPSPRDPNSLPPPGLSYVAALAEALPAGPRIGYSPDLGYAVVQSDVAAVVEDAARRSRSSATALRADRGRTARARARVGAARRFELRSHLSAYLPERKGEFGRALLAGLELAAQMTPALWGEMARQRAELDRWCAALFEQVDLLLTPTVPFDPPPAKGPFPRETEGRASGRPASRPSRFRSTCRGIRRRRCAPGSRGAACRSASRSSARATATTSCCRPRSPSSASARGIRTGRTRGGSSMANDVDIHGACDARFAPVREAFARNFREQRRDRRGRRDHARRASSSSISGPATPTSRAREPWQRDTLVNVYSTTKGMTALVRAPARRRGQARPRRAGGALLARVRAGGEGRAAGALAALASRGPARRCGSCCRPRRSTTGTR